MTPYFAGLRSPGRDPALKPDPSTTTPTSTDAEALNVAPRREVIHPMTETESLNWQYCRDGYDITSQPLYAEEDADEVRAWDGEFCAVSQVRDTDDPQRWRINSTDALLPDDVDEHTFTSPAEALEYLTTRDRLDDTGPGQVAAPDAEDDAVDCC
jgi:hypothetical protein